MDNLKKQIPIPDELDQAVADGMRQVKKIHERRVVRKSIGMAAGVMLFCGGFVVWGCHNPVLASQIPIIGNIFKQNEDKMTYSGDYSEKAQVLDPTEVTENGYVYTASDQDYTFTAEEVYCDGEALYLGLMLKNENGLGRMQAYPVHVDGSEAEVKEAYEAAERGEGNVMQEVAVWGLTAQIGDTTVMAPDATVEGTQTAEDTFEGVVRISLADAGIGAADGVNDAEGSNASDYFDVRITITRLSYADEELLERARENYEAHVLRDANGNELYNDDGSAQMDDSYEYISDKRSAEGKWELFLPVSVNAGEHHTYEINDSADGFGIASVAVTATEIRVESILPPLYADREELLAAKRAFLEEVGEDDAELTDAWVDEYVSLAMFGDYGIAVFDQNGERIEQKQSAETAQGLSTSLPVAGRKITELHIYVGEDEIACAKETDEQNMAARALYHVDVPLNEQEN